MKVTDRVGPPPVRGSSQRRLVEAPTSRALRFALIAKTASDAGHSCRTGKIGIAANDLRHERHRPAETTLPVGSDPRIAHGVAVTGDGDVTSPIEIARSLVWLRVDTLAAFAYRISVAGLAASTAVLRVALEIGARRASCGTNTAITVPAGAHRIPVIGDMRRNGLRRHRDQLHVARVAGRHVADRHISGFETPSPKRQRDTRNQKETPQPLRL